MSSSCPTPTPSDLVIFLDLDNTIISTPLLKGVIESLRENALTYECPTTDNRSIQVTSYKRPFLDLFLQEISTRYAQIHVFTAASKGYADAVLDKLDPNGTVFTKRWYNESCRRVKNDEMDLRKNALMLDCSPLKIDPKRFVLIDDRPEYMMDHLLNGVLVSEFNVTRDDVAIDIAKHDSTLVKVLELLKQLDCVEDVRPLLEEKFNWDIIKHMADWEINLVAKPI
jgi:TFIIF-interacting CTD phosphatase-like protein